VSVADYCLLSFGSPVKGGVSCIDFLFFWIIIPIQNLEFLQFGSANYLSLTVRNKNSIAGML
jgi:hypothetical protein